MEKNIRMSSVGFPPPSILLSRVILPGLLLLCLTTTTSLVSGSSLIALEEEFGGNQLESFRNGTWTSRNNRNNDEPDELRHHFTDQWAVHIVGGPEVANRIAAKHGFMNTGEIFSDHYHFMHPRLAKRSLSRHEEFHQRLSAEPEVRWHEQQRIKRRTKRDFMQISPKGGGGGRGRTVKRSRVIAFNDPRWPAMWYLNRGPGLDMNVNEAWNEGITGKGIVVTILDDGLEKDHPDIVRNYDPMASFDVNSLDMDPMPTYDLTDSNRHGTRCAGEVAAEANNSICAVGVAYEASVGGVRMLDGDVTDAVEARSLSHNPQHIDIYSASWGPDDDGKTVDGPGELATRAFMEGVTKGRAGKGSIFVWASGNGGRDHDNCNCDGYTNSIWTLSISSATENGLVPWYSEACSSTLATTYSSGGTGEKQIVTIDLHHSCTSSHTGTSASAPLAAGICALALQANTNLTWRDMQHIVVRTARPQNLIAPDWATNGVGRNVSHSFGYGLMDAGAMVKLAKSWKTVPEQNKCEIRAPYSDKNIPAKSKVTLDLKVTNCSGVKFLEHVQAKVTLTSGRRGDLQIYLVSPAGTRSTLLAHRRHDLNRAGFTDWPFMSVHSWGENPNGKWTLEIHNEGRYAGRTVLKRWSLIAYGTEEMESETTKSQVKSPSSSSFSQTTTVQVPRVHYPAKIDLSYLKNSKSPGSSSSSSRVSIESGPGGGSSLGNTTGSLFPGSSSSSSSSSPSSSSSSSKSSVVVVSDADLVVTTLVKKPSRQRIKGKLVSKKQKGISPPAGPASQRPATRLVTENPEHLSRSNSNEDETKLFLSTKFSNQSQVNETMRIPLKAKENSLNSSITSSSSSSWASSAAASSFASTSSLPNSSSFTPKDPDNAGINSSINSDTSAAASGAGASSPVTAEAAATSTTVKHNNSPRAESQNVDGGVGGGGGESSSLLTKNATSSNQQGVSSGGSGQATNNVPGKLQTWTLIAHGISSSPNDGGSSLPPSAAAGNLAQPNTPGAVSNSGSSVAVPGMSSGGGGGSVDADGARISPLDPSSSSSSSMRGQGTAEFDGSENTLVIQPSHVQSPPLGIDVAQGTVPVATSASSSSTCAKMSASGQCLDCFQAFVLFHETCIESCPETFYKQGRGTPTDVLTDGSQLDSSLSGSRSSSYICLPCHYSCRTCSGPSDYQCLSCHGDSNLVVSPSSVKESVVVVSFNQSHCYPAALLDTLSSNSFWYRTLFIIILINVVLVALLLIYICFLRRARGEGGSSCSGSSKPILRKSYRRLSPEDEYSSTVLDLEREDLVDSAEEEEDDEEEEEDQEDDIHYSQQRFPSHQRLSNLTSEFDRNPQFSFHTSNNDSSLKSSSRVENNKRNNSSGEELPSPVHSTVLSPF